MLTRERSGSVLTLMLARPEVGNALNPDLLTAMERELRGAAEDPAVRVVVLTGSGKHFSAGADLGYMKAMRGASHEANVADAKRTQQLFASSATAAKSCCVRFASATFASWLAPRIAFM